MNTGHVEAPKDAAQLAELAPRLAATRDPHYLEALNAQTVTGGATRPEPMDDDEQFFNRLKGHARGTWAGRRART